MKHLYDALIDQHSQDAEDSFTTCKTRYDDKPPKTRHQSVIYSAILELERSTPFKKIEEICQEINWYHNQPCLTAEEVALLVNQVLKTANSAVLNLEDGQLHFTESSPARSFLFGNDVIPLGTLSVIGGLGGSGKSMAMVEMIVAAAIGGTYANRK